jgi:hypothetical protein
MTFAMISVSPDVLTRLLALRSSDDESVDDVLRRVLSGHTGARAARDQAAPACMASTSGAGSSGVHYLINGET